MWNMIMAITSPWVGLLLLWFFLLVFFFSQCKILLSGIVRGKTERPFGKWLLQPLKSATLRSGFWLGGLNKFPPKKIQTAKISFREGCCRNKQRSIALAIWKQAGVGSPPSSQNASPCYAHLQPLSLILPSIQHICCVENSHCLIASEAATAVHARDERW